MYICMYVRMYVLCMCECMNDSFSCYAVYCRLFSYRTVQLSLFPVICSTDPDIDTIGGDLLKQHLVKQELSFSILKFPVYT